VKIGQLEFIWRLGFDYWNLIDFRISDIAHCEDSKLAKPVTTDEI
jgi:hypothetical protein